MIYYRLISCKKDSPQLPRAGQKGLDLSSQAIVEVYNLNQRTVQLRWLSCNHSCHGAQRGKAQSEIKKGSG